MERLEGAIQHYDWGSRTAIPDLLGVAPSGEPWAELWLGAHPRGQAQVVRGDDRVPLGDIIDADPEQQLGPGRSELPFLAKVLAADKPLSIQAHPNRSQAEAGYVHEDELDIAVDAFERSFRDRNPKPELICALVPFEALCGFQSPRQVARSVALIEGADVDPLLELLDANEPEARRIRHSIGWILTRSPDEASRLVEAAIAVSEHDLLRRLHEHHPGDVGVLVALLMHHVTLEPGEALFLEAGNLHAYVRGVGVELMANSDNVVRGGLTTKHVDQETLLGLIDCEPGRPPVQRPRRGAHTYKVPVADFALTRVEGADADISLAGPAIALVTAGEATVGTGAGQMMLARGQAAWIPYGDGTVNVAAGDGQLHLATTGATEVR